LGVLSWFGLRVLFTATWTRDAAERKSKRAALLKDVFETLGGAYIKIGQQLSLRLDLLPAEYCDALRSLLDNIREFPFAEARKEIEKQLGQPIDRVFKKVNQNPIGKASLACVYEAWLCDQCEPEPVRVAIKVRRPGIVDRFASDLKTLDWALMSLEYLSILRQGFTGTVRAQLQEIFFDEMDFRIEARFQELFRQRYKKHKSFRVSAPRTFHRYSGKSVMVSEFVDAIPLASVVSAMEKNDRDYLAYLESLEIHPKRLAKLLIRYNFHGFFEDSFFHGDPHPANILVLPDDHLVFIDFGACAAFPKRDRNMMWQLHQCHSRQDIRGMVSA